MQSKHKRHLTAGSLFLGILAVVLFWAATKSSPDVFVLDPAFKILDVQLRRSSTHSVSGGGWQGRLRHRMRRLGLPVTQVGGYTVHYGRDTLALAVYFGGELSPAEMQSVEAVLVTTNGGMTVLPNFGRISDPTMNEHARVWQLNPEPPRGAVVQLRSGTNRPLAEVRIQ